MCVRLRVYCACVYGLLFMNAIRTVFMQIALDQMNIKPIERTHTHSFTLYFNVVILYMSIKSKSDIQLPCCSLLLMAHLPHEEIELEELYALYCLFDRFHSLYFSLSE